MVNQAFLIIIAYRPRRRRKRRRRRIPGIGRYPMGPTNRMRSKLQLPLIAVDRLVDSR